MLVERRGRRRVDARVSVIDQEMARALNVSRKVLGQAVARSGLRHKISCRFQQAAQNGKNSSQKKEINAKRLRFG